MKIAVVGCGSMGCYFGAKLSKKNEVIYIDAFQKSIDSLNQNGITIKEGDKEESYVAPAFLAGKYKGSVDLVLLFVKSTQNIAALSQNETLFNEHTIVMSLQNGFGIEREISRFVSPENIIVGNSHNIYQELKFVINMNVNIYNKELYCLIYFENDFFSLFIINLITVLIYISAKITSKTTLKIFIASNPNK